RAPALGQPPLEVASVGYPDRVPRLMRGRLKHRPFFQTAAGLYQARRRRQPRRPARPRPSRLNVAGAGTLKLDNQIVASEPIRNEVPELVDASGRGVLHIDVELVRDERIEKQTGRLGEVCGQSGETADAFGDAVKIGIAGTEEIVHRVVAVVRE